MKVTLRTGTIPGTALEREKMNGVTGADFLDKVFYVTDGIMLSQIKEITGLDGTTLQNWVKRGWIKNPVKKTYSKEHLASILLLNMMKDSIQISRIMFLTEYINTGAEEGESVISAVELYDCVCRVLDTVSDGAGGNMSGLDDVIINNLVYYREPVMGAKKRILNAVRIIIVSYYATTMKSTADYMLTALGADDGKR